MTVRHLLTPFVTMALAFALAGCSFMHDDLPPCPSGVDLTFVYNYNIQRADMFNDHVGGVTVYVFDENGDFIMQQEEANSELNAPLADKAYKMHLDLEPGTYSFIALAHQKSLDECLSAPGAKFRRSEMVPGKHKATDLNVKLDRRNGMVLHANKSLDTLWHGMSPAPLVVRDMEAASQTISLMRDTKNLTVSLHQIEDPADISVDDFEIFITADNGSIAHDNAVLHDELLTYTPYATWNTVFTDQGTSRGDEINTPERTAHAALSFNRIILYPSAQQNNRNAMLVINSRRSGQTVARINLPDCLAQGRGAFEYLNYSAQEFLDREYDYKLDFFLRGDRWEYIDLSISVLSWSKRIQREEL